MFTIFYWVYHTHRQTHRQTNERTKLSGAAHLAVKQNFQALTIFVRLLLLLFLCGVEWWWWWWFPFLPINGKSVAFGRRQNPVASRPCALQLCTHTDTQTRRQDTVLLFYSCLPLFPCDDYNIVITPVAAAAMRQWQQCSRSK